MSLKYEPSSEQVTRGVYNPIPSCYSADLTAIIKMMLVVDPSRRCNIEELLAHPIIQARINDAGVKCGGPEAMESARARDNLVDTIRVPRQLGQLQGKLPGAKYDPAPRGERPTSARPREEVLAYGNEPASKQARPWTLNPGPPGPSTLNPGTSTLTLNPQPSTLNPQQARRAQPAPSIDGSRANSENVAPPKSHRDQLAPAQDPSRAPSQIGSKMPFVSAYERRALQEKQNRYGNRY